MRRGVERTSKQTQAVGHLLTSLPCHGCVQAVSNRDCFCLGHLFRTSRSPSSCHWSPLSPVSPAEALPSKDLSVIEILEGVIGELTTHSLWGGRGREGSKGIQLFMAIYLVLVHTLHSVLALCSICRYSWTSERANHGPRYNSSACSDHLHRLRMASKAGFKLSNFATS